MIAMIAGLTLRAWRKTSRPSTSGIRASDTIRSKARLLSRSIAVRPFALEQDGEHLAHRSFVVDDEDACRPGRARLDVAYGLDGARHHATPGWPPASSLS
jgi:hypothetical protein